MQNTTLIPVNGTIQDIRSVPGQCCQQMVMLLTSNGTVDFVISQATYVINEARLRSGMPVTAFYDASTPVPLIYPPQYQAVIIGQRRGQENIAAGFFNRNLVSADGSLRLNIARNTEIVTMNGQNFTCNIGNRMLIVFYSVSTRSIPAQTTPRKIIVMC